MKVVQTYYLCYKVTLTLFNMDAIYRGIYLEFPATFPEENLPGNVHFYLTSEDNAYSVTFEKPMNGKLLKFTTPMGRWIMMAIKAEKFIYIQEGSGCIEKSFWKLYEPFYANHSGFDDCPKRCFAISMPNEL